MPDPVTMSLIGAGANVAGSLLGEWWASADEDQRKAIEAEAARLYGDISPPALERVIAERVGPSTMESLPSDFGNRSARDRALQQLVDMGLQGGMDEGSQLALEQARREGALVEQRGRGAVRQEARRRGLGGAGEVAGQIAAQQAGADRAAYGGLQSAADARSRALQALATGGAMAGQAEGQDFDRSARIAASQDAIARFNAEVGNQAARFNAGQQQQEFSNRLGLADRQYEATMQRAAGSGRAADRKRAIAGGVGQAANVGLNAYGQYGGGQAPAAKPGVTGQRQVYAPDEDFESWYYRGGR